MAETVLLSFSAAHNSISPIISHQNKKISVRFPVVVDRRTRSHSSVRSHALRSTHVTVPLRAFKEDLFEINENEIVQSRIRAYHERFDHGDEELFDGSVNFYKDFAAYLSKVWMESSLAEKYYEKAMKIEPCNRQLLREYAEFAWDELRNANKAEEIYERAIQEYPQDVELAGSYALFLWKADA